MITPVSFSTIKHHTYTIFAIINAIIVPCVYFFFPESRRRSLEEMDTLFQKSAPGFAGAFDVVKVARETPHRYGKKGELLIGIDEADDKVKTEHRSGSSDDNGVLGPVDEESQRKI